MHSDIDKKNAYTDSGELKAKCNMDLVFASTQVCPLPGYQQCTSGGQIIRQEYTSTQNLLSTSLSMWRPWMGQKKNNLLEPVWSEEEIMPRASVDILENYNMAGV